MVCVHHCGEMSEHIYTCVQACVERTQMSDTIRFLINIIQFIFGDCFQKTTLCITVMDHFPSLPLLTGACSNGSQNANLASLYAHLCIARVPLTATPKQDSAGQSSPDVLPTPTNQTLPHSSPAFPPTGSILHFSTKRIHFLASSVLSPLTFNCCFPSSEVSASPVLKPPLT